MFWLCLCPLFFATFCSFLLLLKMELYLLKVLSGKTWKNNKTTLFLFQNTRNKRNSSVWFIWWLNVLVGQGYHSQLCKLHTISRYVAQHSSIIFFCSPNSHKVLESHQSMKACASEKKFHQFCGKNVISFPFRSILKYKWCDVLCKFSEPAELSHSSTSWSLWA